jgi:hypothetical protein
MNIITIDLGGTNTHTAQVTNLKHASFYAGSLVVHNH